MNKEHLKDGPDMENTQETGNYQRYLELGGLISEEDYHNALKRVGGTTKIDESRRIQVENLAKHAGIELTRPEGSLDKKLALYLILQDMKPKEVKDSDWRLFREVLRILEDTDALDKLKTAVHTNRRPGEFCPLCRQTIYSEGCP